MRFFIPTLVFLCGLVGCRPISDHNTSQVAELIHASPESQGIHSKNVIDFLDSIMAIKKTEIHHVMILRHGRIVAELHPYPFQADNGLPLYSCSKTFVSAALGIAINDHLLDLDDRVVSFFSEITDYVDKRVELITIEDLLTMRSGFMVDWDIREDNTNWVQSYLTRPLACKPGKVFCYDSMNTYLLSAILQRVTGESLLDYLNRNLFAQMDINDAKWELSPEGIVTGGWGLYLKIESLAKFGHLLLCEGKWNGKQLIPSKWVKKMMQVHVNNSGNDDYCYHMWRCSSLEAVRADGAFGQLIYIIPNSDMVVVLSQCFLDDYKEEEFLIKNVLLPDIRDNELVDGDDFIKLKNMQVNSTMPLLQGKRESSISQALIGKQYKLEPNILKWNSVRFVSSPDMLVMEIEDVNGITSEVRMGYKKWILSSVSFLPLEPRIHTVNRFSAFLHSFHIGTCYAWSGEELRVKMHFVDWVSSLFLSFHYVNNHLCIEAKTNFSDDSIVINGIVK